MKLDLGSFPPEIANGIRTRLVTMLMASPFRAPRAWARAVVVIAPERKAVLHRLAFAAELGAAGLSDAAHEVAVRRVGPGEVLAYVLLDNEHNAGVEFVVVPVLR